MYEKFIFICSYGRTGSTLLKNIISTIPDSHISGENGNSLYFLFQSFYQIEKFKIAFKKDNVESIFDEDQAFAYLNKVDTKKYQQELWQVFLNNVIIPKENSRVIGFKEIRALHDEKNLSAFINFMLTIAKDAKILFATRNDEQVMNSAWWAKDINAKEKLVHYRNLIEYHHNQNKDKTYICHYNTYLNNFEETKKIFDFLEEDMDYEKIQTVINKKTYS